MPNNLSSRLLRYVSITVSLFLGLYVDLGLKFSSGNDFSSFLKRRISWSFLPYYSKSVFNFCLSILLVLGTNFRPLNSLLLMILPSNLSLLHVASYIIDITIAMFFFNIRSIPSTTNYLILIYMATLCVPVCMCVFMCVYI